jgi:hypothetical protein
MDESPRVEIVDLVADFGGYLRSFLGMSWLSFVELFGLILQIMITWSKKIRLKKTNKTDVENFKNHE